MLIFVLSPNIVRTVGAEGPDAGEEFLVRFSKGNDVFAPHEVIALEILPRSPKIVAEKLNLLTVTLHRTDAMVGGVRTSGKKFPDDSTRLASTELEVSFPSDQRTVQWIPVSLIMPTAEGVYDIGISFQRKGEMNPGQGLLAGSLQRRPAKTVIRSVISCVVINSAPFRRSVGDLQIAAGAEQPDLIDSANPAWWKRLPKAPGLPKVANLPKFPGLRPVGAPQNPTNSAPGIAQSSTHSKPLAELFELWKAYNELPTGLGPFTAPASPGSVPWEASQLSIKEPGKPHLLELKYPSGIPQTLGIAVVELIHADGGPILTVSAESGINVVEEIVSDSKTNRFLTHQIVFWPKTKSPMLLLTNHRLHQDILIDTVRTIRLADAPNRLSQPFGGEPQRLLAGYIHRPEVLEPLASSIGGTDWQTLYEGATRFVDRLRYGGYDGTMLVVATDGKTLYPATHYESAVDAGPLIGIDGRPVQKDVLELIGRLFDREGLTLIPAIDFNSPLPALERAIQRDPNLAAELAWTGPDGPAFLPPDRSRSVSGPFYNLLHPLVQDTMIDTVRELATRGARHPSFGGVSIVLSPNGFAQIPDPFWGLDDLTIAQFQQEMNIELPGAVKASPENASPSRFAARAQFFQTNVAGWAAWIHWRTLKVNEFYRRAALALTEVRPDATLYLAGGTMLDSPTFQQYCTPSLLSRTSLAQVLRLAGFDPILFAETPSVVFLRPNRSATEIDDEAAAVYRELETAEFGTTSRDGVLFFHGPLTKEQSMIVPSGERNRRRFVQRLAQEDIMTFFDGGTALPLGEEEAFHPLAAAFRQLPKTPFQTFVAQTNGESEKSLQPVTVRFLETPSGLFVYLLNDAPFSVEAKLTFTVSPNVPLEELGGRRPIDPAFLARKEGQLSWLASLAPYDFIAVRLPEPTAVLRSVDVYRPTAICGPNGTLKRKIDEIGERIQTARNGIQWNALENPGCEMTADSATELVGWTRYGGQTFTAAYDSATRYSGNASLKLESKNATPSEEAVLSNVFPAPETGRLFVSAFLGVSGNSPPLNVVLAATYRAAPQVLRFRIEPEAAATSGVQWRKIVVPFDRLPKEHLEDLRIGFELIGPGTVWIDDVTLYHIAFTKEELAELHTQTSVADFRRSADRISDLLVLLEGYWPEFLSRNVPMEPSVTVEPRPVYTENNALPPSKPDSPGAFGRFKSWFIK